MMVDNLVNGIFSKVSRINSESLSPEARTFFKQFKEDLVLKHSIDKSLGNLVVKTIIKFHQDKGDSPDALIAELVTVAFHAIEPHRKYAIQVAEYFILSTIFAFLTITEDSKELGNLIEQTIVSVMTNPIYEFDQKERSQLISIIDQVNGYIAILNRFTKTFTSYLPTINSHLREGMRSGLELCNANSSEYLLLSNTNRIQFVYGSIKFFLRLGWPLYNFSRNSILKWINKKIGFDIWPTRH